MLEAALAHWRKLGARAEGFRFLHVSTDEVYGALNDEKLIPLTIIKGLAGEPMPVYGRGLNVRDWLFVDDHAQALTLVLERGRVGEINAERRNVDVVGAICDAMDHLTQCPTGSSHRKLINFVPDRPGHDFRYAMGFSNLNAELG